MSDIKTYIKLLKKYHQRQFIIDGDDEKYAKYFIFLAKEIYNITDDTIKQLLKKIIINSIYINREILFFICKNHIAIILQYIQGCLAFLASKKYPFLTCTSIKKVRNLILKHCLIFKNE